MEGERTFALAQSVKMADDLEPTHQFSQVTKQAKKEEFTNCKPALFLDPLRSTVYILQSCSDKLLSSLKQQKLTPSQFRNPAVQNQSISRVGSFKVARREQMFQACSLVSHAFWKSLICFCLQLYKASFNLHLFMAVFLLFLFVPGSFQGILFSLYVQILLTVKAHQSLP